MKKNISTMAILLAAFLAGCYYDKEETLYPSPRNSCDTSSVSFSGSVKPLLSIRCYGCHSNANASAFGGGRRLENYSDVRSNASRIYSAITHQSGYTPMPSGGGMLDDCSIAVIRIWNRNGSPDN
jgi:hypothetical protein